MIADRSFPPAAQPIGDGVREGGPRFSICTIVTRPDEYRELVDGFIAHGFDTASCEFLYADNAEVNRFDAHAACNIFLRAARGDFIVLCHQDVALLADGRARLDAVIAELDARDPAWGLFGNAGGVRLGRLAVRISDPHGEDVSRNGPFPVRCETLDENFIVVRRAANLALPRDRHGFHFYGTELCLFADMLGWNAYVVDFHLRHRSPGTLGRDFLAQLNQLVAKYQSVLRPRLISTTCTDLLLSASPLLNRLGNRRTPFRLMRFIARLRERWHPHVG